MPERGSKTSTVPVVWANLDFFRRDPNDFLSRLLTVDETWLYSYDPEAKLQSMECRHSGSPCPKKINVQKSAGKVLASIFWNQDGILLIDCLPKNQTIKAECYSCFSLHKDTTPPQPNHTVSPTHIEPEQYNTWNKSTISRKLLKMDVLTFETCWAVNSEIIKWITSSCSIFIQLSIWCTVK